MEVEKLTKPKPGSFIPCEVIYVKEPLTTALSWVAGCAAALIFVGGLVYWNEVVIPRQAMDDMCEAKYQQQYDFARDLFGRNGIQSEAEYYKLQAYELNKCKVAGYARLKGVR